MCVSCLVLASLLVLFFCNIGLRGRAALVEVCICFFQFGYLEDSYVCSSASSFSSMGFVVAIQKELPPSFHMVHTVCCSKIGRVLRNSFSTGCNFGNQNCH